MEQFRIIIADDDDDDFFIIKQTFNEFSIKHKIDHVADGRQLLDNLNSMKGRPEEFPDLILMDINMPKVDGIKALQLIRKSVALLHIPVIMYSTTADQEQIKKCSAIGANGFITKGSTHEKVIAFVKSINNFLKELRISPDAGFVHKSSPSPLKYSPSL
jgi:CheY-like chemotaxis protein